MKNYKFEPKQYQSLLHSALLELQQVRPTTPRKYASVLKNHAKPEGGIFAKDELVAGYNMLVKSGELLENEELLSIIKLKPTRSISGVVPVTVLTKPFPCPGKCIFCPNDIRMPKSYLSDEPGAQRAEKNMFDPYLQTYNRLLALNAGGHKLAKIELIVLGGTWSFYPENYQIWFIKRCFDALNEFGQNDKREEITTENIYFAEEKIGPQFNAKGKRRSYNELVSEKEVKAYGIHNPQKISQVATWSELLSAQKLNETATARCVGLVLETRPDYISEAEIIRVRKLGATKTQIGFQSLQDNVLELNHRGHDVAATEKSVALARAAGFKIHAHWMPNLYGSTPELDKQDYLKLFTAPFQPDELKIYPCSLIETAELMDYYKKGLWKPYTEEELLDVLSFCLENTPRHVRLTRVIRDIPSTDIVVGNKKTNFREIAERHLTKREGLLHDIRAREVKGDSIDPLKLSLKISEYNAHSSLGLTKELFLEYITPEDKICGFLRLSLPVNKTAKHFIAELQDSAMIREVHVYGVAQLLGVGGNNKGFTSQHLGLGTKLITKAKELAKEAGFEKLAVISAIGTREYYRKQGFLDEELYQTVLI